MENRAGRKEAWLMHRVLFEQFVGSFEKAPSELVLDFDCIDHRVHGRQVGAAFHGYYYDYCFLALYVFCGEQLLVSYLRPSNIDPAKHAWAILRLLVNALRKHWPGVKITVAKNDRLNALSANAVEIHLGALRNPAEMQTAEVREEQCVAEAEKFIAEFYRHKFIRPTSKD
jgi:DDE family transposase